MSRYWLTPLHWNGADAILGAERFLLEPGELGERWIGAMKAVHPRLLLPFKSGLLLSDETNAESCGITELPFLLDSESALTLRPPDAEPDGGAGLWSLSHCAEAYLHRIPSVTEALDWLARTEADFDEAFQPWLRVMKEWLAQGRQVILLKED